MQHRLNDFAQSLPSVFLQPSAVFEPDKQLCTGPQHIVLSKPSWSLLRLLPLSLCSGILGLVHRTNTLAKFPRTYGIKRKDFRIPCTCGP